MVLKQAVSELGISPRANILMLTSIQASFCYSIFKQILNISYSLKTQTEPLIYMH